MRKRQAKAVIGASAVVLGFASHSLAVSWNATDPSRSAITTTGLSDKTTLFADENVVNDTANSTRGTGTYLGDGWVLTAQHVLTGSANIYGTLATPNQITMTVSIGGVTQNYTADTLSVPSSADIGLIHLAGTTTGPITQLPGVLKSAIQTGTNENNTLVQLGGYGYYGPLTGTLSMDASFHRAFNIATTGGSFMNVPANGSSRLVNNAYVLGIGQSGDSGSGLWMDTGADSDTNLWDYNLIGALDTTSVVGGIENNFGSNNQYSRISSNAGWLLTTAYSGHTTVTWDANSATTGIQEGSGTWNLSNTNFGNGVDNFAWDNSTTKNAFFGAHKGTAGVVTLGANVSVQNMMFDPAVSGTYTIAPGAGFSIALASNSIIMSNADSTISATLSGGGATVTKLGPATLTLSGTNTFTGTLAIGNGATSGGNLNGAVRIASNGAFNGLTTVNLQDNNGAWDVLQFDGTTANGNLTIPASVGITLNGNNAGPAGTAATIVENIGGSNVYNGAISGTTGGIGYGFAVDAGSISFNTFTTTTSKTLYFRGPGNGSFTGVVSGASVGINQTGSGTWTLNAANTYSLATTLAGGVLSTSRLANGLASSGIGNSSNAAANLVFSGGTLRYTGTGASIDRLFTIGAGGGTIDSSGSGALSFSNIASTVSSDAATHASITTAGSNVVSITSGGGFTDLANGMSVTGTGIPFGATITSLNFDAGTITLSASSTAAGTLTLSFGALPRVLTLTGSNSGNNTLSSKLVNSTGGGTLGITKTGTGLWILSAFESYTGPTLVNQGALTLNGGASLASTNDTVSSGAIFNISGSLPTATNLTDNGTTNLNTASQTLATLNGSGALNVKGTSLTITAGGAFSGPITDSIGGAKLNVTGGTLTLSGTGSNVAIASITNGNVLMNGALGASGAAVTVGNTTTGGLTPTLGGGSGAANGGALAGSSGASLDYYAPSSTVGNIQAAISLLGPGAGGSAGHLAPGNSVGTLQAASLIANPASVFDYEFNTLANDLLDVTSPGDGSTSGLVLDGGGFNLFDEGTTNTFDTPGTYHLLEYSGILGGSLSNLSVLDPDGVSTYFFSTSPGTGPAAGTSFVDLTIAVPEPASISLLAVGAIALLRRRKGFHCFAKNTAQQHNPFSPA